MKNGIKTSVVSLSVFMLAVFSIPCPGKAEQHQIAPGKYVTEGGWGDLSITMKGGRLSFAINSFGSNAHTCSLDGTISNGMAELPASEDGKPCIVTFQPRGNDIEVTDSGGECHYYCGVRARFSGLYLKPKPGCDAAAVQKSRRQFKQLYNRKDYAQARVALEPVLNECSRYLHRMDVAWIRNDLAITQYRLGEYEECLQTLKPIEEDALKTDDELREFYPPADADIIIPVAGATRTNLKLCRKKAVKRP